MTSCPVEWRPPEAAFEACRPKNPRLAESGPRFPVPGRSGIGNSLPDSRRRPNRESGGRELGISGSAPSWPQWALVSLIDNTTSPVESATGNTPLRSCQSPHNSESTLRSPTCGHRPFPSRAASCGHGLPRCGWPASLQSPATPEEVDGIRRLGGQQESVRHERDNDNCELKVIHLKLKFRVGAGAHSHERLLFQDLVRQGACVVGPKDIDH